MTLYILLLILLGMSGFCAAAHVAFFSLSPVDLKLTRHVSPRRLQQIERLLAHPRDLLVTVLLCDVSANILIQQTVVHLFGATSSWMITVGLPILLTLLLGEIIPKSLALPFRMRIARTAAPFFIKVHRLLKPLGHPISRLTSKITQLMFPYLKPNQQLATEEVSYLVNLSKEGGVLSANEALWLDNYLSLYSHTIKERMHSRDELPFFNIEQPLEQLSDCFEKSDEIVVCRGDLQNVLGCLSASHYLVNKEALSQPRALVDLLHSPLYAPKSLPIPTLFRQMLNSGSRLCLIVDEYGVIVGWATRHDLMRFILQNPTNLSFSDQEPLVVHGKMELEEFFRIFQKRLSTKYNMSTLGGWLIEQIGDIPKQGTTLSHEEFVFQILDADHKKIKTISIRREAQ